MESIKNILARRQTAKGQASPKSGQATPHQQLAVEIAESFGDVSHIGVYLKICKQFDLNAVRKIWRETLETRAQNPGAYFTKIIYDNHHLPKSDTAAKNKRH